MRIATRGSELALWQARHVGALLIGQGSCDVVELVIVSTSGDRDKHTPLHVIGGKGIFVKEVQAAVLDGRADLAVHSAKDMPAISPDELVLGAVPERGDPRDALVGCALADLRPGALVATGSARRRAQLAALRPDLTFDELRGNIATRLDKADAFDAIVMAAAALERLELAPSIVDAISPEAMVPQVGQGSLAIEVRTDDAAGRAAVGLIDHHGSRLRFESERAFLRELGGDCSLPAGAFAELDGERIRLAGFLASQDLSDHRQLVVDGVDGVGLGSELARRLRAEVEAA